MNLFTETKLITFLKGIKNNNHSHPIIISIAGGSCVGKSTVVKTITEYFKDECVLISQDDFQIGEDSEYVKNSIYKWDDKANFAFEECYKALLNLKNNRETIIPMFSLKENRRVGSVKIAPKKVIIFEGIYAFADQLLSLADYKIYLETKAYARFLRRIFRFTNKIGIRSVNTPVKHMLLRVIKAHKDFVIKQKENADIVFYIPYSFSETERLFALREINFPNNNLKLVFDYKDLKDNVAIRAYENNNLEYTFTLEKEDKILFITDITEEMFLELQSFNFEEL